MADNRLYGEHTYDYGFVTDETIRINPRLVKVQKLSANRVAWFFDNCAVDVTADGEGDERHNFKAKVGEGIEMDPTEPSPKG